MSDFYGGENPGGEDPNKKKPGMGKKFLLILLAIVLVSGVVGGGVYYVTQMWVSSIAKYFLPLSCRASGVYW